MPEAAMSESYFYICRYTLGLVCYMNLRYFPMDKQKCYMKIESCE